VIGLVLLEATTIKMITARVIRVIPILKFSFIPLINDQDRYLEGRYQFQTSPKE
jgi:hypothetical protein